MLGRRTTTPAGIPAPAADSVALITGASSGIGEQFARQLADAGHRVALVARRYDRLERLAEELGGPSRAVALAADLAVPADRDRISAWLNDLGVQVDVLVNNAGVGVYGSFAAEREPELRLVRVDIEAIVDLMARFLPSMLKRRRGTILNMSSTTGFQPLPYFANYAAAKAYVLMLSEAVHEEVKAHGVTVTAVCPGPVSTEFQAASDAAFMDRLPRPAWTTAERVVRDALAAVNNGQRSIIPGGPHIRASFAPSRLLPTRLSLIVTTRLMRRDGRR